MKVSKAKQLKGEEIFNELFESLAESFGKTQLEFSARKLGQTFLSEFQKIYYRGGSVIFFINSSDRRRY